MRTTVNINDKLYLQLKRRALDAGVSVSSYIEDAVKFQILEDIDDLEELDKRLDEPTITHEEFVRELKSEGLL